jgi:hypothetical protein
METWAIHYQVLLKNNRILVYAVFLCILCQIKLNIKLKQDKIKNIGL